MHRHSSPVCAAYHYQRLSPQSARSYRGYVHAEADGAPWPHSAAHLHSHIDRRPCRPVTPGLMLSLHYSNQPHVLCFCIAIRCDAVRSVALQGLTSLAAKRKDFLLPYVTAQCPVWNWNRVSPRFLFADVSHKVFMMRSTCLWPPCLNSTRLTTVMLYSSCVAA